MERKLRDEYYVSEKRMKEFFDKYTKLTFVSMYNHLFSEPPSCFPSIFHKIIVSWEEKEYYVSFEMCDQNAEVPWVYNFQTDLPESDDMWIHSHYFDYQGCISKMRLRWFIHNDSRLETIKRLEDRPIIDDLHQDAKALENDIITIKLWQGVTLEEMNNRLKEITDKIDILSAEE